MLSYTSCSSDDIATVALTRPPNSSSRFVALARQPRLQQLQRLEDAINLFIAGGYLPFSGRIVLIDMTRHKAIGEGIGGRARASEVVEDTWWI
jgi:hypothetical protein